ncbi:MAG: hypothetical protein N2Z72_08000 [Bacteroidales bacterium]|nr:hypothetical protein [Bacteroidales bacterium]
MFKVHPFYLQGIIDVPASKSFMQRALICAAFCKSKSVLHHPIYSDDTLHLIHALQLLGAEMNIHPDLIEICGQNFLRKLPPLLNSGESGFNARVLSMIASLTEKPTLAITGEKTLLQRPMNSLHESLKAAGIAFKVTGKNLPIWILGKPTNFSFELEEIDTSQILSGMMLAFPSLNENNSFKIHVKKIPSIPYVHLTKQILELFGVNVEVDEKNSLIQIPCSQTYQPVQLLLEGDWSHAALWLSAAAINGNISIRGLNESSAQGDRVILNLFSRIHIPWQKGQNEISLSSTEFYAFEFDLTHYPDLAPAVVLLALAARGKSVIHGCERLTNKESNRLQSILSILQQINAHFEYKSHTLHITGRNFIFPHYLEVPPDHRMVMFAILLGVLADKSYTVPHLPSINKSYPTFINDVVKVCRFLQKTS